MRRLLPEPDLDVDIPLAYAYPEGRPWLRVNMVASSDGGAWVKGLSGGLSSKGDRRIFGVLRGLADVILVGASTVRTEAYGPARPRSSWEELRSGRTPAPPIAVITRRLDVDLASPLFTETEAGSRTIVITCESAPADRRREAAKAADVVIAGDDRVDLARAVAELHARGLTRVLCEGGPRVNGQLATAGVLDELCLTLSPMLIGGGAARILNGEICQLTMGLAHLLEEEGFLFCKYVRG
ncbi:Pyrimidine reductase, riboflavin biosynthesis [Sinosporangium album]|uniref:Pyrimidine reductase, riboflavin biosynthesis n=1 Tax=Sinosporangium album TaxID=504805 RepID=A0A1G8BM86_9ACTN|nr:pyrimidine reductase family protein [Sinosporangium album]SDH34208.1 Pyrimidine reductase, riboflavin biosynthesis [Sinosporangium album]